MNLKEMECGVWLGFMWFRIGTTEHGNELLVP